MNHSTLLASADSSIVNLFVGLIELAVLVVIFAGLWKTFVKAGKPGWACIVPIYNLVVLLEIAGKPLWWILLCLIPCVNIVILILVYVEVARKFGRSVGFAIGLVVLPFIFFPILGFGDAQYNPAG